MKLTSSEPSLSTLSATQRRSSPREGSTNDIGFPVRRGVSDALVAVVLFLFVLSLQWLGGAYTAEFGGHPDEPAHYVTGLMVRDYLADFPWGSPLSFAENYYLHYPKVALGHWPPFFYGIQAVWTLIFSPSRSSLLLLMAVITALLAFLLYRVIRREFSSLAGLAAGALLVTLPVVQWSTQRVMADVLVALLSFSAVIWFGRYMETERWRDALLFGLLASAAIMTKGSALALGLVPPLAIVFRRQWRLLTRPSLWLSGLLVIVLCGPWQLFALRMVEGSWETEPGWSYAWNTVLLMTRFLIREVGVGLLIFVVIGIALFALRRRSLTGTWAAASALLVSVWVLHALVPTGLEPRFLIQAMSPVVMFAVAGIAWTAERLPLGSTRMRYRAVGVAVFAASLFVVDSFVLPRKPHLGFSEIAQELLARPELRRAVFLVASDAAGEGAFISEVAMRERRPGHVVLRGTKALASADWMGRGYTLRHETPEELLAFLEEVPVSVLVVDHSPGAPSGEEFEHQLLLRSMLDRYPEHWKLVASSAMTDSEPGKRQVVAYQLVGSEQFGGHDRAEMLERLREFARH